MEEHLGKDCETGQIISHQPELDQNPREVISWEVTSPLRISIFISLEQEQQFPSLTNLWRLSMISMNRWCLTSLWEYLLKNTSPLPPGFLVLQSFLSPSEERHHPEWAQVMALTIGYSQNRTPRHTEYFQLKDPEETVEAGRSLWPSPLK